jgi:putative Mg2+ transporter-C (MgtC) family protein
MDDVTLVFRLLLAAVLGAVMGLEREMKRGSAGLRTHLLVSMGACLYVLVSAYGFLGDAAARDQKVDLGRAAAYVAVGIGFLGGGVIVKHGENVRGLTTAANLWLAAAVGVTCGAGNWKLALFTVALGLLALVPLGRLEKRLPHPTLHEDEQTEA